VQLGVEIALSVSQSVDTKMSILNKLGMLAAEKTIHTCLKQQLYEECGKQAFLLYSNLDLINTVCQDVVEAELDNVCHM